MHDKTKTDHVGDSRTMKELMIALLHYTEQQQQQQQQQCHNNCQQNT